MQRLKLLLTVCCFLGFIQSHAQKKSGFVSGKVVDENEHPISGVSIIILGKQTGTTSSDSGSFKIKVPAEKSFALVFSFSGYKNEQRNFYLSENEEEKIIVRLESSAKTLEEVVITDQKERKEVGLVRVNPRNALIIPSATGGVESLIKVIV